MDNYMKIEFPAKSSNEAFARATVGAFAVQLDITATELADIKTAVSEAVTNSIVHGYINGIGIIYITCRIIDNEFEIIIEDKGVGIENIELAMQPLYTTNTDGERSGMGFTVMQTFMDNLEVVSKLGEGTIVKMKKAIKSWPEVPMTEVYTNNSENFEIPFEILIKKALDGDIYARTEIVEKNIGLVWSVVKKFSGRGVESEDLFQIGCIGLIKAIDKFDTSFNVKFSTYAVPMIMGEIKRFLRDDGIIKVSRSLKELAININDVRIKNPDKDYTIEELAEILEDLL